MEIFRQEVLAIQGEQGGNDFGLSQIPGGPHDHDSQLGDRIHFRIPAGDFLTSQPWHFAQRASEHQLHILQSGQGCFSEWQEAFFSLASWRQVMAAHSRA
jgi:hypothetical protein